MNSKNIMYKSLKKWNIRIEIEITLPLTTLKGFLMLTPGEAMKQLCFQIFSVIFYIPNVHCNAY
jgi:hypothetical protein